MKPERNSSVNTSVWGIRIARPRAKCKPEYGVCGAAVRMHEGTFRL